MRQGSLTSGDQLGQAREKRQGNKTTQSADSSIPWHLGEAGSRGVRCIPRLPGSGRGVTNRQKWPLSPVSLL